MTHPRARLSLVLVGVVGLALVLTPRLHADFPTITGNGGFDVGVTWQPNPPTKVETLELHLTCHTGYTCGLTKVTIDWDDGQFTVYYSYLPIDYVAFQHEYAANGLAHVKMYGEDEDENGNWFDVRPIDVTISS